MRYEVIIKSDFSAAHRVQLHKAGKESLHGHNWLVEANITSPTLDENGMVIDFIHAREHLKAVLAELDHRNLNESPILSGDNPTAERIARFIYENLEKYITAHGAELRSITVWETRNCAAIYKNPVG
jgi:6-pyruvoyltetrahydropterin/6-carboxytetrahydropterin synthase